MKQEDNKEELTETQPSAETQIGKQPKKQKPSGGLRKNAHILLPVVLAAAVICVCAAIAIHSYLGKGSEESTLQTYYGAMYGGTGSAEDIAGAVVYDKREDYYNQLTNGGTNFACMGMWQGEAIQQVGENPKAQVEVIKRTKSTAQKLKAMQEQYAGAEDFHTVAFRLTLTGDTGKETLLGVVPMIKLSGKWYFTTTSIELKVESRTENGQGA